MLEVPALFRGLCDDAAIFPPGLKPLAAAVTDHLDHVRAPYAAVVGPLVLSTAAVAMAAPLLADLAPESIRLAIVGPVEQLAEAISLVADEDAVELVAVEAPIPADADADTGVARLQSTLAATLGDRLEATEVFVEIPRDDRSAGTIEAVRQAGWMAKLRTGGIRADLYPDETELAESILALTGAGVPFKATAGLHHAVRNTDHDRGFEQHGFLNVLWAVDRALAGCDAAQAAGCLAERDATHVARELGGIPAARAARIRQVFRSFGTCSVSEPVDELTALGLLARTQPNAAPWTSEVKEQP
jgi:hypothetical protein